MIQIPQVICRMFTDQHHNTFIGAICQLLCQIIGALMNYCANYNGAINHRPFVGHRKCARGRTVLMSFAYPRRLMKKDTRMIGIGHDNPQITVEDKIRYDACITIDGEVTPDGELGIQTIQGGLYAVYLHKGSYSGFSASYSAIISEWLPASGKSLRNAPCREMYLNRDPRRTKPENLRTEIYIPIE